MKDLQLNRLEILAEHIICIISERSTEALSAAKGGVIDAKDKEPSPV